MGKRHDLGLRAVLQPQVADPLPVLGERPVVPVGGAGFLDEDEGPGVHESADVVDVAVGVVAGDPAPEPEHVGDAQPVAHGRLEALAPQAGVADLLPGGEVALLGREQRAPAVDLDAAAFEDEVPAPDARRKSRFANSRAAVSGTRRSLAKSAYLAQALKWKCTIAVSERRPAPRRTKTGPLSRVQPRLVGWRTNLTRESAAPARARRCRASLSSAPESTRMRTSSPGASLRTISP